MGNILEKKNLLVVAAVIRRRDDSQQKVLIVRRGPKQSNSGMWEFPGGKVELNEAPEDALVREIREELCLDIEVGPLVGEESFDMTSKILRLRVYECATSNENLKLIEHDEFKWIDIRDLDPQILSEPDRPFVQKLRDLMP